MSTVVLQPWYALGLAQAVHVGSPMVWQLGTAETSLALIETESRLVGHRSGCSALVGTVLSI